jgi:hypothetical protein
MKRKMIKRLLAIETEISMMRLDTTDGGLKMGDEMDALRAVSASILTACRVLERENQKKAKTRYRREYALKRMSQAIERLRYWVLGPYANPFEDTYKMRRWVRSWGMAAGMDEDDSEISAAIQKIDNELLGRTTNEQ